MVEFVGLIKVNVVRGIDLVIRDVRSSDPYVMLCLGNQVSLKPYELFLLQNPTFISSYHNIIISNTLS